MNSLPFSYTQLSESSDDEKSPLLEVDQEMLDLADDILLRYLRFWYGWRTLTYKGK